MSTTQDSSGFNSITGLNVHSTGKATTDHDLQRWLALNAVRVLHKHNAMDLLPMLFAPLNPTPKGSRL